MFSPEKTAFFENLEQQGLAVTYDDVRLRTIVMPDRWVTAAEVDIRSRFSTNVELITPIVSSPMDTVTGSETAIAMAKLGGLGIIHAAYDVKEQRDRVRRVKLHLNGLIENPIAVSPDMSVEALLAMKEERGFEFSTFPVVNSEQKFVGMFTQADVDFCENRAESVEQHMTPLDKIAFAEEGVTPHEAFRMMREHGKLNTLPLLNEDGTIAGLYVKSDVKRLLEDNPDNYNLDANGRLRVGAAVSTDPDEALERVNFMGDYVDVIVVDSANGNSRFVVETLRKIKATTEVDVVAGNVSEGSSAVSLAQAGADGIRVGQGGGSICTTRKETGIGMPQVSAVWNCAKALAEADYESIPVCADGGLKDRGDIPIAFMAGAHNVMMGNMLAATKESPGKERVLESGRRVKEYRGMGSAAALRDNAASRKRYASGPEGTILPEGVQTALPYKGSLFEIMPTYIQALRKSMEYLGAPDIKYMRQQVMLTRITNAGLRESHPHDI